jgi:hypothetical protein
MLVTLDILIEKKSTGIRDKKKPQKKNKNPKVKKRVIERKKKKTYPRGCVRVAGAHAPTRKPPTYALIESHPLTAKPDITHP